MTPSEELTENYIRELEDTIAQMKSILEIEIENTAPGGVFENEDNHKCLTTLKAFYKVVGAYIDR